MLSRWASPNTRMGKMTNPNAVDDGRNAPTFRWVEPATILALFVGSLYYLGWSYTDGYFQRIGLRHAIFNFSTTFYLTQSFWAASLSWMAMLFLLSGREAPKTKLHALYANLGLIFLIIPFLLPGTSEFGSLDFYIGLGFVVCPVIAIVWLSWNKKSIGHLLRQAEPVIVLILVIPIMTVAARTIGEFHGRKTIQGDPQYTYTVSFAWKEAPIQELEGKELILIVYQDSQYYVAIREKPAPAFPKVYVVPVDQLKHAVVSRIN